MALHVFQKIEADPFSSYVNGNIYQALMGEKSRDIKLTSLIAEGEDYEQVGFEWLGGKENI